MPDTAVTGAAEAAANAASNVAEVGGVLGSLVIILLFVCASLIHQLIKVQNARVDDAKKVAADSLAREDKWQGVLKELSDAVERLLERTTK